MPPAEAESEIVEMHYTVEGNYAGWRLDKYLMQKIRRPRARAFNTLVGQLVEKYGPGFEAHPAHRLDRETSGLVVCGRTTVASRRLFELLSRSEVSKEYLAIVEGHPPDQFEVDAPIAEGTEQIRIAVRIDRVEGKPAQTRFKVQQRFERAGEPFALVRCYPRSGRQHQIRIHAREPRSRAQAALARSA